MVTQICPKCGRVTSRWVAILDYDGRIKAFKKGMGGVMACQHQERLSEEEIDHFIEQMTRRKEKGFIFRKFEGVS